MNYDLMDYNKTGQSVPGVLVTTSPYMTLHNTLTEYDSHYRYVEFKNPIRIKEGGWENDDEVDPYTSDDSEYVSLEDNKQRSLRRTKKTIQDYQ